MIERVDPPDHAPEKELLVAFLDYYRATLLRKADGITDEQARTAPTPPSELTLMGLVRHMAAVEHHWFRRWWENTGEPWLFDGPDPDADFHPGPNDTMPAALAMFTREVDHARRLIDAADPDQRAARRDERDGRSFQPSMRWILVHMIEEYARHCGHADLIREAIDGSTGD